MSITGAHVILYTSEPDAVRAIFRDVLAYPSVDAGGGWLIFQLPAAEVAVHPSDGAAHELSFMCDDLQATIEELRGKGLDVDPNTEEQRWGVTTTMHLPGGLDVLLYEPRHPTPSG